jgi:hypothetical protein
MQARVSIPNRDERYVINMDQTPVYFSMTPTTRLEKVGARTVNMRNSSGSTMRVTVAVTVTASGHILPSLLVFKGTPGLRRGQPNPIQAELNGIDSPDVLRVQERAWMSHDLCVA